MTKNKQLLEMGDSEIILLEMDGGSPFGSDSVFVLKVPSGWIYNIYTHNEMNSVFVPTNTKLTKEG